MLLRIILYVMVVLAAAVGSFLGGFGLTGSEPRAYVVLDPTQVVQLAKNRTAVQTLARIYQPVTRHRSALFTLPLLWDYYEVVDAGQYYVITYYHVWEDEIHPNPVLHDLYWVFRAAYYGYPVHDIEYAQVTVDKVTTDVAAIQFETSPGNDYYPTLSKHILATYTRQANAPLYDLQVSEISGGLISSQAGVKVDFDNQRVLTGPATWNHLTTLVAADDPAYDQVFDVPLKFLTDEDYQSAKFARKSHGQFFTQENQLVRAAAIAGMLLVDLLVAIFGFKIIFKR